MKKIINALLRPPLIVFIPVTLIFFPLVFYLLFKGVTDTPLSYVSYIGSAYALVITIIRLIHLSRSSDSLRRVRSLIPGKEERTLLALEFTTLFSALYGLFLVLSGIFSLYLFTSFSGIYYILLSVLRYTLAANFHEEEQREKLRRAPWLLLSANILMVVMILVQITGEGRTYPGFLIYAIALYTFYICTLAAVNLVKARKSENEAYRMARALSLSAALVSLFSLQQSLIETFGSDNTFKLVMNVITGTVVALLILTIPIVQLVSSRNRG